MKQALTFAVLFLPLQAADLAWVIVGAGTTRSPATSADSVRARQFRAVVPEPYLWFRKDGREFIVTDRAAIREAYVVTRAHQTIAQRQLDLNQIQLGAVPPPVSSPGTDVAERAREVRDLEMQLNLQRHGNSTPPAELAAQQSRVDAAQERLTRA